MLINIYGIYFHIFEIPVILILIVGSFFEIYARGVTIRLISKKNIVILYWSLVLYLAAIALSIVNALDYNLVIKSLVKWIEVFVIAALTFFYLSKISRFKFLYWTLFLSNFISIIFDLFRILLSGSTSLSNNMFSGYESVFALALLFPFLNKEKSTIIRVLFAICLVSTVFSFTRGAYLALIATAMYYFFSTNIKFSKIFIIFGISILTILLIPIFRKTILNTIDLLSTYKAGSNLERFALFELAISAFLDSPITGVGSLNFPIYSFRNGVPAGIISKNLDTIGPHNTFLQIAAEEGIIGLSVFCFILFALFKVLKRKPGSNQLDLDYVRGLRFIFIAMFFNLMLGFITSQHRFYLAIFIGLTAATSRVFIKKQGLIYNT